MKRFSFIARFFAGVSVAPPCPDTPRGTVGVASHWRLVLTAGFALLLCMFWASCSGFFINPSISSIFITPPSATIVVNNTVQLNATARYSDGSSAQISGSSVGWSIPPATPVVATVSSPGGLVTGVSTGNAVVTCTDQGVTATAAISVLPFNVTSLSITTTQGSTNPQSTATISGVPATLQFYAYANGTSIDDVTQAVSWSSSTPGVATISTGLSGGNGLATSVSPGTTNITATITTNNTVVSSNIIVLTVQ